jgi:hypothetical protein
MTDDYSPSDIRVLADMPPVRKRGGYVYGGLERPDLWERALEKCRDAHPEEKAFKAAVDEYMRLLKEDAS